MSGASLVLTLVSGVAWTLVYVDAVRLGIRQRTYAMPLAAFGLNIAWEVLYTVLGFAGGADVQTWVNLVWACGDLAILYTVVRYGPREFPHVSRPVFYTFVGLVVVASALVQVMFRIEFGPSGGPSYSAFLQNLLMSGLFIAMYVARGSRRGQSLLIAVSKWLGTLAPTVLFGVLTYRPFILVVGLLCSVFDLVYVALLWRDRTVDPLRGSAPELVRTGG
ncbi:MAG TPA: hypothetical protein VFK68_08050 [Propionibacteriaceae bacterium]|nr:hypothetical protein [Propionibacteriaceae bacterium]